MDKHTDIVNHPSHYELAKFECIEVMEEVFGKDALKNFKREHDGTFTEIEKSGEL